MKKLLFMLLATVVLSGAVQAQNLLTNGDFSAGSANWTTFETDAVGDEYLYDFAATTSLPTGATSPGLSLTSQLDNGSSTTGAIYQAITVVPGNIYQVEGRGYDTTGSANNTWLEAFLTDTLPVAGTDVTSVNVAKMNNWNCSGYDGLFSLGCETPNSAQYTIPGGAATTWYFVVKSGVCCGGAGVAGAQVWTVDDLSVVDLGAAPSFDSPPTNLDGSFDTVNAGTGDNNYGGTTAPASGDGNIVQEFVDASGATGGAGDYAWRLHDNGTSSTNWQNGGMTLSPGASVPQDLTTWQSVTFDARIATGSHASYDFRIEDSIDDAGGEFNNDRATLTFTDTWDSYAISWFTLTDGTDRTGSGRPTVTLTNATQMVFEANGPDGVVPFDLYIDNLTFNALVPVELDKFVID